MASVPPEQEQGVLEVGIAEGQEMPPSTSTIFWRCPAPLVYVALCVAVVVASFGWIEGIERGINRRLVLLRDQETVAFNAQDVPLLQQMVRNRGRLITWESRLKAWMIACLSLIMLALAASTLRVILRPAQQGYLEWAFLLVMQIGLALHVVVLATAFSLLLIVW
jgi:hypothetical protein